MQRDSAALGEAVVEDKIEVLLLQLIERPCSRAGTSRYEQLDSSTTVLRIVVALKRAPLVVYQDVSNASEERGETVLPMRGQDPPVSCFEPSRMTDQGERLDGG